MDKTLKSIKLQEDNIGNILFDMSAIFFVSVCSSMGNNNKKILKKCDLIKLKIFFTVKEIINKTKR